MQARSFLLSFGLIALLPACGSSHHSKNIPVVPTAPLSDADLASAPADADAETVTDADTAPLEENKVEEGADGAKEPRRAQSSKQEQELPCLKKSSYPTKNDKGLTRLEDADCQTSWR